MFIINIVIYYKPDPEETGKVIPLKPKDEKATGGRVGANKGLFASQKLIEFMNKETLHKISEQKLESSQKYIKDNFKFITNEKLYTYKDILKLADKIKSTFKYDGIFIDPYNSLIKDNELISTLGGHEYDYQACTELRMFCKKKQVTIWVSTHANTGALRLSLIHI